MDRALMLAITEARKLQRLADALSPDERIPVKIRAQALALDRVFVRAAKTPELAQEIIAALDAPEQDRDDEVAW